MKKKTKFKTITGMGNALRKAYGVYVNIEKRYTWIEEKVNISYYLYIANNICQQSSLTFLQLQTLTTSLLDSVQKVNKEENK